MEDLLSDGTYFAHAAGAAFFGRDKLTWRICWGGNGQSVYVAK